MLVDSRVGFVIAGTPLSLVAASGVDVPTDPYDFLGNGPGTAVTNIYGNSTLPGQADAMGVGPIRPELAVAIGTALATGTAATLNVQLQGAPDDGSNNPGTYQTYIESGPITAAQGTAGTIIARFPWVPPFPQNHRPRFLRLNFEIPAGTLFTAGTIAYAQVTSVRDDPFWRQAAKNYSVSGPNYTP